MEFLFGLLCGLIISLLIIVGHNGPKLELQCFKTNTYYCIDNNQYIPNNNGGFDKRYDQHGKIITCN